MSDAIDRADEGNSLAIIHAASQLINAFTYIQSAIRELEQRIAAIEAQLQEQGTTDV